MIKASGRWIASNMRARSALPCTFSPNTDRTVQCSHFKTLISNREEIRTLGFCESRESTRVESSDSHSSPYERSASWVVSTHNPASFSSCVTMFARWPCFCTCVRCLLRIRTYGRILPHRKGDNNSNIEYLHIPLRINVGSCLIYKLQPAAVFLETREAGAGFCMVPLFSRQSPRPPY